MAKGFTPTIGLAVVVALALVAVFGAMSLTPSPAHAQDAICTAAGFIPNQAVALDASEVYDVTACFGGSPDVTGVRSSDEDVAMVTLDANKNLTVEGKKLGSATIQVATASNGVKSFDVAVYNTGPKTKDSIPGVSLGAITMSMDIEASDYFTGQDLTFEVESSDSDKIDVSVSGDMVTVTAKMNATGNATIMVTAKNPINDIGVEQSFTVYIDAMPTVIEPDVALDRLDMGASRDVDVADYFSGSRNTYAATSSDDNIVEAKVAENTGDLTLTGVGVGNGTVTVTATNGGGRATIELTVQVRRAEVVVPVEPLAPVAPTFMADDYEPGKNSWYTLNYNINSVFNGGLDTMTIKLEGFGVPSSIGTSGIALEVTEPASDSEFDRGLTTATSDGLTTARANMEESFTFNPASVAVDGKEIVLTLPDVRPEAELTKKSFDAGSNFKVIVYQSAGVSNPTKANVYGGEKGTANSDREIFVSFGGSDVSSMYLTSGAGVKTGVRVPRVVQLDEEDGGLGDVITATALGFQNSVTLHFFLDKPDAKGNVNGMLDAGEDILCTDVETSSDHIGTCEFTVATPTFSRGMNYVNAVDGNGNEVDDSKGGDNDFELKASISVSPAGGAPGEIMQVQLVSFPTGSGISRIALSGDNICGGNVPSPSRDEVVSCSSMGFGSVGSQGTKSIGVTVPNWAVAGVQQLKVWAGGEDDDHKVTIVGPRIIPTPQTVVANQRVSLVGSGFSPSSELGDDTAESREESSISIGGYPIPWTKVNDGRNVQVDDGGNWSASLDLPLVEATTGSGDRTIRITDSKGRTGAINVALADRNFDITPPEGRVGTLAVVRGMGYPSKNDEGHSFTVDVIYKVQEGATARVSVVPDASGRFEVQLRIPTTASIPSTNQVEVTFGHEAGGTSVTENKQHFVPEGIIELSATSGGPGTVVTLSGEGFKTYVPVESVKIGTIEITPAPKPNTDANGMMSFEVLIPGLDVGIQTVEVKVGGTTSSTGFTVTESGLHPGNIVEVAMGLEDLGDNFVNIWHFNNDLKTWSFYDGDEGSDLTHLITGETYLLQVKSTVEVILNRDTRSVTCVGSNCWNQIVW